VSTYIIPRPCDPQTAAVARVKGRTWTLIPQGEDVLGLPAVAMPLNFARVKLAEIEPLGYSLASLTRHDTLDGTYWTWEPCDDPGGPLRIQRRRAKGWRKPDGSAIIDRTSRWGNPFRVADAIAHGFADNPNHARTFVVGCFDEWLDGGWPGVRPDLRRRILRELPNLRGRDLACTCPVDFIACHGDSLIRRANGGAA
jgi:Domain of unknown function (DUF4326)